MQELTDKEVLEKAIEIAIKNGWVDEDCNHTYLQKILHNHDLFDDGMIYAYEDSFHVNRLVFNQDFAKAFWGEERKSFKVFIWVGGKSSFVDEKLITEPAIKECRSELWLSWRFHLKNMVLRKNPIDYLREDYRIFA